MRNLSLALCLLLLPLLVFSCFPTGSYPKTCDYAVANSCDIVGWNCVTVKEELTIGDKKFVSFCAHKDEIKTNADGKHGFKTSSYSLNMPSSVELDCDNGYCPGECESKCPADHLCKAGKCVPCEGDECTNKPECKVNSDCSDGKVCKGGECEDEEEEECEKEGDCEPYETCTDGKCLLKVGHCKGANDCKDNQACKNNRCEDKDEDKSCIGQQPGSGCGNGKICNINLECGTVCQKGPEGEKQCADGTGGSCLPVTQGQNAAHACTKCKSDDDCQHPKNSTRICIAGSCTKSFCSDDVSCPSHNGPTEKCNNYVGICFPECGGSGQGGKCPHGDTCSNGVCVADEGCAGKDGQSCGDGKTCHEGYCGCNQLSHCSDNKRCKYDGDGGKCESCKGNKDCPVTHYCNSGKCVKKISTSFEQNFEKCKQGKHFQHRLCKHPASCFVHIEKECPDLLSSQRKESLGSNCPEGLLEKAAFCLPCSNDVEPLSCDKGKCSHIPGKDYGFCHKDDDITGVKEGDACPSAKISVLCKSADETIGCHACLPIDRKPRWTKCITDADKIEKLCNPATRDVFIELPDK